MESVKASAYKRLSVGNDNYRENHRRIFGETEEASAFRFRLDSVRSSRVAKILEPDTVKKENADPAETGRIPGGIPGGILDRDLTKENVVQQVGLSDQLLPSMGVQITTVF